MARYLSIIDSAYRATIEEQDDTAVWFTHAMKNGGAEVSILLRGDAVSYVLKDQDATGLRFGARAVKGPDLAGDVGAVIGTKIPVYVVAEDLRDRGITSSQLISGIEQIQRRAIAKLLDQHDRILTW